MSEIVSPQIENNSIFTTKEGAEYPIYGMAAWAGGVVEVSGTLGFNIQKKRLVYPQLQITDSNLNNISKLKELAGGRVYPHSNGTSHSWVLGGKNIYRLTETIKGFAPSRALAIDAIQLVEQTDVHERLKIVQEYNSEREELPSVTEKDYYELVNNPQFTAGIIDAKGSISALETWREEYGYVTPQLSLFLQNLPLLNVLKDKYGGSVSQIISEGQDLNIEGRKTIAKSNRYVWTARKKSLENLLVDIGQYLQFGKEKSII